jgi:hypothetical protein
MEINRRKGRLEMTAILKLRKTGETAGKIAKEKPRKKSPVRRVLSTIRKALMEER